MAFHVKCEWEEMCDQFGEKGSIPNDDCDNTTWFKGERGCTVNRNSERDIERNGGE
jgi:hypothetical protein